MHTLHLGSYPRRHYSGAGPCHLLELGILRSNEIAHLCCRPLPTSSMQAKFTRIELHDSIAGKIQRSVPTEEHCFDLL